MPTSVPQSRYLARLLAGQQDGRPVYAVECAPPLRGRHVPARFVGRKQGRPYYHVPGCTGEPRGDQRIVKHARLVAGDRHGRPLYAFAEPCCFGSGSGSEPGSESGSGPGSRGSGSGSGSGSVVGSVSGSLAGSQRGSQSGSTPGSRGSQSGSTSGPGSRSGSGSASGSKAGSGSGSKPGSTSGSGSKSGGGSGSGSGAGSKAGSGSGSRTGSGPGSQLGSGSRGSRSGSGPGPGCPDGVNYQVAAVSNKTGGCTCLPDTLIYQGSPGGGVITQWGTNTCPGNVTYQLMCEAGQWGLNGPLASILVSYTPGTIVFDVNLGPNCGSGGTARITITPAGAPPGGGMGPQRLSAEEPPVRHTRCISLGMLVERDTCLCPGKHWHRCEQTEKSGYRLCRPGIECQGCTAYEADG